MYLIPAFGELLIRGLSGLSTLKVKEWSPDRRRHHAYRRAGRPISSCSNQKFHNSVPFADRWPGSVLSHFGRKLVGPFAAASMSLLSSGQMLFYADGTRRE